MFTDNFNGVLNSLLGALCIFAKRSLAFRALPSVSFLFVSLLAGFSSSIFASTPAGDVAPYGNSDGQVNAADLVILQRFIANDLAPSPAEVLIADVAPLGTPDGVLNVADLLILNRAVLGLVNLPPLDILFFIEGFESQTPGQAPTGGIGGFQWQIAQAAGGGAVDVTSVNPITGTQSLRFFFAGNAINNGSSELPPIGGGTQAGQRFSFPATDLIRASYQLSIPSNYKHRQSNGSTNPLLVFAEDEAALSGGHAYSALKLVTGADENTSDLAMVYSRNGVAQPRITLAPEFITTANHGTLIELEVEVKLSSSASIDDGHYKVWINGVLIANLQNLNNFGGVGNLDNKMSWGTLIGLSSSGYDNDTTFLIDDFKLYNTASQDTGVTGDSTPPGVISDFVMSSGVLPDTQMVISFAPSTDNIAIYRYELRNVSDGSLVQSHVANGQTISGLTLNTAYSWFIRAVDTSGNTTDSNSFSLISEATSVSNAHRLLLQATFGPTESEIDRVVAMGTDAWIDEQLAMPSAYDSDTDNHKTHFERTVEIANILFPARPWVSANGIFNETLGTALVKSFQISSWWENALGHPDNPLHGSDQLRQRVAYALSQLLVTSVIDPRLDRRAESLAYYNDILANNAFGNYRTLIGEVSRSPTMGVYLSHQGNAKADPANGVYPDENFARELMQLFTIGPSILNMDGTHDKDGDINTYPDDPAVQPVISYDPINDVQELAKVVTGWDLKDNKDYSGNIVYGSTSTRNNDYAAPMEFFPAYHEDELAGGGDGYVTLLGNTFALNSGADGSGLDSALDILFNHPNIGPFISRHLITNLVTSNPSSAYVVRVASVFNDNGQGVKGDLKAVVRAILTDVAARDSVAAYSTPAFGKIKEPTLAWAQMLRVFNVTPLYGWTGPDDPSYSYVGVPINDGVYVYRRQIFRHGQAPYAAQSVFNFYLPDYVPSDPYFSSNRLVAPESQILSDQIVLRLTNVMRRFLRFYEKNYLVRLTSFDTIADYATTRSYFYEFLMLIDFDRELQLFELTLDGDNNGDFMNMESIDPTDNIPYKEKALDALLTHLDKILLGNSMTPEYRDILADYLLNSSEIRSSDDFKEAHNMIREAATLITTSSAYMIQK